MLFPYGINDPLERDMAVADMAIPAPVPTSVTLPESLPQDHANHPSFQAITDVGDGEQLMLEARPEDGHEPAVKKLKRVHGEAEMVLRQTAEMVMVLVGVAALRGGAQPSPLECQLAAEAYEKLTALVTVSAPQDLVPKDALQTLIQQLTLPPPPARPAAKPVAIQSSSAVASPPVPASPVPSPAAAAALTPALEPTSSPSLSPSPAPGSLSSISPLAPPQALVASPEVTPVPAITAAPSPKAVAPASKAVSPAPKTVASATRAATRTGSPATRTGSPATKTGAPASKTPALGTTKSSALEQVRTSSPALVPSVPATNTNIPGAISTTPTNAAKTKHGGRASPVKQQATPTSDTQPTTTSVTIREHRGSQAPKALARQRGSKNVTIQQPVLDPQQTHQQLAMAVQLILKSTIVAPALTKTAGVYMSNPIACGTCKLLVNTTNNVLVCDGCESGFHLSCLQLSTSTSIPKGDWYCPKCVMANAGRPQPPKYGPLRRGPAGQQSGPKNSWSMQGGRGSDSSKGQTSGKLLLQSRKREVDAVQESIEPAAVKVSSLAALDTCTNSHPEALAKRLDTEGLRRAAGNVEEHAWTQQRNARGRTQTASKQTSASEQEGDPGKHAKPGVVDDSIIVVEWVGPVVNASQDNLYYSACSVGGVTLRLQDTAFFRPELQDVPPYIARLQALWEDKSSGQKWVKVNWCYYPSDLPVNMGRPATSNPREVYGSNHSDDNLVGSIQGPCLVLPPLQYQKEVERRSKDTQEDPIPLFLCQWFYDAPRGLFRATSDACS